MSELVRPVKCHLCGEDMFYDDDPRFVPELAMEVKGMALIHIHQDCWDVLMVESKKLKWPEHPQ
jgi:hypothetical protein